MGHFIRFLLYAMAASCAFAQLDSSSITVSASRGTSVQGDQAVFAVNITTDINAGLSDVLAAVAPAGLTQANFVGVSSGPFPGNIVPVAPGQPLGPPLQATLQWVFGVPVPISKTKDMVSALTDLQHSLAQVANGPRLSFSVQGTQVSQQSQTCPLTDLIADARAQAQKLAGAAGLTAGNVLAISSSIATSTGGSISGAFGFSPFLLTPTAAPPCFVTVKFALR